jgi:hypothetical protein
MILFTAWLSPARRSPAVTVLGTIPFIPLNVVLGIKVLQDSGPAWGFFLGAAGAAVAFAGAAGLVVVGAGRRGTRNSELGTGSGE